MKRATGNKRSYWLNRLELVGKLLNCLLGQYLLAFGGIYIGDPIAEARASLRILQGGA